MKTILLTLIAMCAVKLCAADNSTSVLPATNSSALLKIGTADATNHYGQEMIVTGMVAQVTIRPTVTFLNLDEPFPDSPFTVVIFHGHSSFYGNANAMRGKSIEIRGKITKYHDKPEIALDSTNQLTVFDSKGVNITAAILQTTNRAPAKVQSPAPAPVTPLPQTNASPGIM